MPRLPVLQLGVMLLWASLAAAPPSSTTHNITLEVPAGTTSHGNPHMLCTPPLTIDLLIFFLTNYVTHAVTVKSYPGEFRTEKYLSFFAALMFPTSGLVRGLNALARHSIFTKGSLERAARSGALCMVVRNAMWKPEIGLQVPDVRALEEQVPEAPEHIPGRIERWSETHFPLLRDVFTITSKTRDPMQSLNDQFFDKPLGSNKYSELRSNNRLIITTYIPLWCTEWSWFWLFPDTTDFYVESRTIHGYHHLPEGYSLAYVPRDAKFEANSDPGPELGASYSFPKAAAGVVQTIYSSVTLNRARGAQISQYGYAAFALTVLPYTLMSVINFFGNMITPDYPTLYIVESDVLLEAKKRGAIFQGVVGKLVQNPPLVPADASEPSQAPTETPAHTAEEVAVNGNPAGSVPAEELQAAAIGVPTVAESDPPNPPSTAKNPPLVPAEASKPSRASTETLAHTAEEAVVNGNPAGSVPTEELQAAAIGVPTVAESDPPNPPSTAENPPLVPAEASGPSRAPTGTPARTAEEAVVNGNPAGSVPAEELQAAAIGVPTVAESGPPNPPSTAETPPLVPAEASQASQAPAETPAHTAEEAVVNGNPAGSVPAEELQAAAIEVPTVPESGPPNPPSSAEIGHSDPAPQSAGDSVVVSSESFQLRMTGRQTWTGWGKLHWTQCELAVAGEQSTGYPPRNQAHTQERLDLEVTGPPLNFQIQNTAPDDSLDSHASIKVAACSRFERGNPPPEVLKLLMSGFLEQFHVDTFVGRQFNADTFVGRQFNADTFVDRQFVKYTGRMPLLLVQTAAICVNLSIIAVLGILSNGFSPGSSTKAQRGWIISWFVFGVFVGLVLTLERRALRVADVYGRTLPSSLQGIISLEFLVVLGVTVFYAVPAIGGFVVVGRMIHEFGTCTHF